MEAPLIRSRILVVALILFVTGSALAWNRTYRRATAPQAERPDDDRYMAIDHGGRIVSYDPPSRSADPSSRVPPSPNQPGRTPVKRIDEPAPTPEPPVSQVGGRQVEVQKGDNLHRVAERALGRPSRWREIADLNNLRPPYTIQPGQTLHIPSR